MTNLEDLTDQALAELFVQKRGHGTGDGLYAVETEIIRRWLYEQGITRWHGYEDDLHLR